MKKISLLTKIIFHTSNIGLIILYLYPGSILGYLAYNDIQKQPQLTSNFIIFSSNHVYAFILLSVLGLISHHKNKVNILFLYLFFISIFLELCHILIPQRDFEFRDLYGNFLGVFLIFLFFKLLRFFKQIK
ncbi:hypothetical protein [Candidatus Pelagibacter communis]|uniref:hypothetical protein n=1 Tax=Pelagibacter ubique TaxID=198252 RepID=UPI00094CF6F2|nr:hypothetical protein [Candidatus Pelagibacter ubique]|tara:strand:- start:246 stop:638 length:393 start_codon:yes stop_codon:yes gene_type:complete